MEIVGAEMKYTGQVALGSISRGNRGSAKKKSGYAKVGLTTSCNAIKVHHEASMSYVFHRIFLPTNVDEKYADALYFWSELEDCETHKNGLYARTIEFWLDRSLPPEA